MSRMDAVVGHTLGRVPVQPQPHRPLSRHRLFAEDPPWNFTPRPT